jgi:hypothetical protein
MNDTQVSHFSVKYSNILYIVTSVPNLNIYHDIRDLKRTLVVESPNWRHMRHEVLLAGHRLPKLDGHMTILNFAK